MAETTVVAEQTDPRAALMDRIARMEAELAEMRSMAGQLYGTEQPAAAVPEPEPTPMQAAVQRATGTVPMEGLRPADSLSRTPPMQETIRRATETTPMESLRQPAGPGAVVRETVRETIPAPAQEQDVLEALLGLPDPEAPPTMAPESGMELPLGQDSPEDVLGALFADESMEAPLMKELGMLEQLKARPDMTDSYRMRLLGELSDFASQDSGSFSKLRRSMSPEDKAALRSAIDSSTIDRGRKLMLEALLTETPAR